MAATSDGKPRPNSGSDAHGVAADQLKSFVERIQRLTEEKKTIAEDIKSVYGECKAMGYDTKIVKKAVAILERDEKEVEEEFQILDHYLTALGRSGVFG
ncbi:DUF2312 domain-containing protein [Neorhizobium galegae]|uniref:DUF2312 domain-containing protein n=1 Tax=Neorhizobium galegae TaxID=399 RepID=UPI0006211C2D|nr:DUF2312 domain-containing protein [Neorhizobium galegae]CDZ55047.1 Hypothetical protein NGAL_HAMBI2427_59620 [Neorhizobium galegae bv. orientalis]